MEFSLFLILVLEYPRSVAQFFQISRVEALFPLTFPRVRVANQKMERDFTKKVYPQPPLFGFFRTKISSDNIQLPPCYFVTYRKRLKEVIFVNKEFLHENINNKDVYVDYSAITNIP